MFTGKHINEVFAKSYYDAAIDGSYDMTMVATLLESIRPRFNPADPYNIFTKLKIDQLNFDSDRYLKLLASLKKEFFETLYTVIKKDLDNAFEANIDSGELAWQKAYFESLLNYQSEIYARLCTDHFPFSPGFEIKLAGYREINRLLLDIQWFELYEPFSGLAGIAWLPAAQQLDLQVTLGLIKLYLFPDYKESMPHFERAASISPRDFKLQRALAQYYIRSNEYDKALNILFALTAEDELSIETYNITGDLYKEQGKLPAAEGWYHDALKLNCFHADAYARLMVLYGSNPELWSRNKQSIPGLLKKTALVEPDVKDSNTYYLALRDAAAAFVANKEYEQAAYYYNMAINLKPSLTQAYIDLSYVLMYEKKYAEAEQQLRKAVEIDKNCYEGWWGLAYLFEQTRQLADCMTSYKRCLDLRKAWAHRINNSVGVACYNLEDYTSALDYYKKAINEAPGEQVYYDNIELCFDKLNDTAALDVYLEELQQRFPSEPEVLYRSGIRKMAKGEIAEALKYLKSSVEGNSRNEIYKEKLAEAYQKSGDYVSAESIMKQLCESSPTADRYNVLGNIYFAQKSFLPAIACYEKGLELDRSNIVMYENVGLSYERLGDEVKAEEWYLKGIAVEPDNSYLNNRLGLLKYKQGNCEDAIPYYKKAISANAANIDYYLNIGLAYEGINDQQAAIDAFGKAIELNPHDAEGYYDLGYIKLMRQEYSEAIELLQKAVTLNPGSSMYHAVLGKALYELNDITRNEEAIKAFERAAELDDKVAKYYNYLGVLYYQQNDLEKALMNYRKAISLEDSNYVYYDNIALVYKQLNNVEGALQAFENAARLSPKDSWLYNNEIGILYYTQGLYDKAIEYYKKSLKDNPSDKIIWQNLSLAYAANNQPDESKEATIQVTQLQKQQPEITTLHSAAG